MNYRNKAVVLYHGPGCPDGFAAAYAAWKALGDENVAYIPVNHRDPVPLGVEHAEVIYVLDFCWPEAQMRWLSRRAQKLVVLDHHITMKDVLANKPWAVFDENKSGARLAWEHFHPGKPAPIGILFVEDRDLWRWEVPGSRAFGRMLAHEPRDFQNWDRVLNLSGAELDSYLAKGEVIDGYHMGLVRRMARHARPFSIEGFDGLAVEAPSMFASEVGHLLAERSGTFGAVWQLKGAGEIELSLRAIGESVDVGSIAAKHGGGGHRSAAGMQLPIASLSGLL